MRQFTALQIAQARQRVTPEIIQALIANNNDVIYNPVLVPETGCATWNHYFFCPQHSVRLVWDRRSPKRHHCPIDNMPFSGEPYDGAWWRWLNGLNAKACYEVAVLWLLTGEESYLNKVRDILLSYARYYPDYQEHGGISYNGPGKANAQTLCEANCHIDFARGFDIIRTKLTADDEAYIAERLLRVGADFLMKHRSNQIHNHEVKINSAIGIIGSVLDEKSYLEFAVNSKYGLRYQLEHALMPGGLWFEGSLHYHFYALSGFMAFEKVARGSGYSLLELPHYQKMLDIPFELLLPDLSLPNINDCVKGQERFNHTDIYEFAWWYYGKLSYGELLSRIYRNDSKDHIDALFYGRELPETQLIPPLQNSHSPENGLTIIRNKSGRAICFNYTPYGGEHDHYCCLSLIVFDNGKAIFPDLGTTGYGAPLHYDYYKNSFSHNTVCINGRNQPPVNPVIKYYKDDSSCVQIIAEADWKNPPVLPDSKIRIEWDNEAYKDVLFRRNIISKEDILIDIITIENPHNQTVETTYLIDADLADPTEYDKYSNVSDNDILMGTGVRLVGSTKVTYQSLNKLNVYCMSLGNSVLFQKKVPNNPSTSNLESIVLRSTDSKITHIVVTDFSGRDDVKLNIHDEYLNILVSDVNVISVSIV